MNYRQSDLIEIYKTEMERFDRTRNVQWKFNVTAWALLVLAIEFKSREIVQFDFCTVIIAIFFFFIGHLIFVWLIQNSLMSSKAIWNKILKIINNYDLKRNKRIKIKINKITKNKKWRLTDVFWIMFQILITAFLLFIFGRI